MDRNSESNIRLFIRRIRARLRSLDPSSRFPVEEGWRVLKARIDADQAIKRRTPFLRRYAYAAAVILCILTAGGYWVSRPTRVVLSTQRADKRELAILPASRKVQLILAGGRRVALDTIRSFAEKGGVTIRGTGSSVEYKAAATTSTIAVEYNTLEVPRGHTSRLTLPDGTRVWINAASRVTFPTAFTGATRELTLEGEAYFEVSKDMAHPFIVHAKGMAIRVLGTSFNVNMYEPDIITTLVKGRVRVSSPSAELLLEAGEQGKLDGTNGLLGKTAVNTRAFTAWKDGDLFAENISFVKLAQMLGREFDYDLVLEDTSLQDLHFTVDMVAPGNLQEVLDYIRSTTSAHIQFETTGRTIKILRENAR